MISSPSPPIASVGIPPTQSVGLDNAMARNVTGKAYRQLAAWAGEQAGIEYAPDADLETRATLAVTTPAARECYECLVLEYEQRLRDNVVTLEQIRAWLVENHVEVTITSVFRDRDRLRAVENRHKLAADRTKAVMSQLDGLDCDDAYQKALRLGMQKLLGMLLDYDVDALLAAKPAEFIAAIDCLGKIGKMRSEKMLIDERLKALRAEFDARLTAATRKAPDGRLDAATLAAIGRDVFGA
jgi:hypothetical protein